MGPEIKASRGRRRRAARTPCSGLPRLIVEVVERFPSVVIVEPFMASVRVHGEIVPLKGFVDQFPTLIHVLDARGLREKVVRLSSEIIRCGHGDARLGRSILEMI